MSEAREPLTATELEELYRRAEGEIQDAMCHVLAPILRNMLELARKKGLVNNEHTDVPDLDNR